VNPPETETPQPLTLFEQLDAMLLGWLEGYADRNGPGPPDARAAAVVTVADAAVAEIKRFCASWDMHAERIGPGDGRWAVLRVDGPLLPLKGFAAITEMYRS